MYQKTDFNNFCFLEMDALSYLRQAPQPSTDNQPLILVYSQEPDTRFLFRTILEIWKYRVIEAESLEGSISAAENKKPDLVLMDTSISFVENLMTMRNLRKAFDGMPFILLSGHSQARFRRMAIALGANDFLVKPIDFDLLENSLKESIKWAL